MRQSIFLRIQFSDKNEGYQLHNREQTTEQFQRVQKKIEIPQLQFVQETMRSEVRRRKLEKTFEEQETLNQAARAWNIECLQYEIREIISPASIKQAMEMQAEAEHMKRAESFQQSEGDQQSKINSTQRRATRLRQC